MIVVTHCYMYAYLIFIIYFFLFLNHACMIRRIGENPFGTDLHIQTCHAAGDTNHVPDLREAEPRSLRRQLGAECRGTIFAREASVKQTSAQNEYPTVVETRAINISSPPPATIFFFRKWEYKPLS